MGKTFVVLLGLMAADFAAAAEVAPPHSAIDIISRFVQAGRDEHEIARLKAAAAAEPPSGGFTADRVTFYSNRIDAARRIGDYRRVISDLQELHKLQGGADHDIVNQLASASILAGNKSQAIKYREDFLGDWRVPVWARMHHNATLAGYFAEGGDLEKGRSYLKRAEEHFEEMRGQLGDRIHPGSVAQIDYYRGDLAYYSGKFEAAEAAYRRSVVSRTLAASLPTSTPQLQYGVTLSQTALSRALLRLNRLAEAEHYAREAVQLSVETTGYFSLATARSLSFLCQALVEAGRHDDAAELARPVIAIFEDFDANRASYILASARLVLGEALIVQGRMKEADAVLSRRAADLQSDPVAGDLDPPGSADWGYALIQLGRAGEAIPMLRRLARWNELRRGKDSLEYLAARAFEAMALARGGDRKTALELFRAVVPQLTEATLADSFSEGASFRATLRLQRVIDAYLAVIAQSAAESPQSGTVLVAEAFSAADIARGSGVQRAIQAASVRATIRESKLAELARREQDLGNQVASLANLLTEFLSRPSAEQAPKVKSDLEREIARLKEQRSGLRAEILKQFPDYAALVAPKPVSLSDAQARLAPEEALISFYSSGERTYVWAVRNSGPAAFAEINLGAAQVASMVAQLRRALDVPDPDLSRFPRFDTELAHQLYGALVKPVDHALTGARSLIVVPHGALGQIPFALLLSEPFVARLGEVRFAEYRSAAFLVRKYAISQIPSVSTLVTLRRSARSEPARLAFAGFGNPVFAAGAAATDATTRGAMRVRSLEVGRVDARGARTASNTMGNLAPLPDTALEVREVASALGADLQRDIFLENAATETNIRKQDLSNRRVLIFATHGLVPGDLDGLTQPALALSNPAVTGERDVDGLLTMDEVLGLRLNADWVVLSACNTAAADGQGQEAVSGLGRAFFFAGARALLVSNWPVETVSARLITTDLFRREAADARLSRAEALRLTLVNLIDHGATASFAYAHPLFWAPFTLVGEGASR